MEVVGVVEVMGNGVLEENGDNGGNGGNVCVCVCTITGMENGN